MKQIIVIIAAFFFIGCKPSVEKQFKGAWLGQGNNSVFIEDNNNVSWTLGGETLKGKWMIKDEKLWVSGIHEGTWIFNLASDGKEMRLESIAYMGEIQNSEPLFIFTKQE